MTPPILPPPLPGETSLFHIKRVPGDRSTHRIGRLGASIHLCRLAKPHAYPRVANLVMAIDAIPLLVEAMIGLMPLFESDPSIERGADVRLRSGDQNWQVRRCIQHDSGGELGIDVMMINDSGRPNQEERIVWSDRLLFDHGLAQLLDGLGEDVGPKTISPAKRLTDHRPAWMGSETPPLVQWRASESENTPFVPVTKADSKTCSELGGQLTAADRRFLDGLSYIHDLPRACIVRFQQWLAQQEQASVGERVALLYRYADCDAGLHEALGGGSGGAGQAHMIAHMTKHAMEMLTKDWSLDPTSYARRLLGPTQP